MYPTSVILFFTFCVFHTLKRFQSDFFLYLLEAPQTCKTSYYSFTKKMLFILFLFPIRTTLKINVPKFSADTNSQEYFNL